MRLTGAFVLVLAIFVFAGSALAGNGRGKGNGNGGDGSPGNSASAPGQVKKDSPSAPAVDPTGTTTTTSTTTTTTTAVPTEGVKPSNSTSHDTHAPASSNRTKKYGNGQTAGAIAIHHGASPSTVLHGPGNSQPHKAAPCSGGHEIDVHALKGRRMGSCGVTPDPTPTPNPTPDPGPNPGPPTPTVVPTTKGHKVTTHTVDPAGPRSGEAVGKTASHRTGASAGVLAATRQAELPFTGLRLWIVAALGLLLMAAGGALRQIRTADAPVQSGHDHTDRSRRRARGARSTVGGRSGR